MNIKILGADCKKCKELEAIVRKTIKENDIEAEVEKIVDIQTIIQYGVMTIPALVVDEKVVSTGKVLKPAEILGLLK